MKIRKYFGTKSFYKMVFMITIPIILQQVLINIVNLADNVMVGQLTSDKINGVYISSQIMFVCNLGIFGAIEGSSIFFAQYFGSNDEEHLKYVFKFKAIAALIITSIFFLVLAFFIEPLALLFTDVSLEVEACKQYVSLLKYSLFFFALSNVLSTSFREVKKTSIPMWASALGLLVNIGLNYILIFGHFGFKEMGVVGAALATFIARLIELLFLILMTYVLKMNYVKGLFKPQKYESELTRKLIRCSIPLLLNEILWSTGQMVISIALSSKGNDARNALSIATVMNNLFYIGTLSLGNSIAIIVGNTLGEGHIEKAKIEARQLIMLALLMAFVFGAALFGFAPLITTAYNVSDVAKQLAINAMRIYAVLMFIFAINCSCFFVIRTGGNTKIVLVYDSLFAWGIQAPVALIFAFLVSVNFETLFFIVYIVEIIKTIVGLYMVKQNKWAKNIVGVS